jgi:hypothetical protein
MIISGKPVPTLPDHALKRDRCLFDKSHILAANRHPIRLIML